MIYLASPYNHADPEVMLARYYRVSEVTAAIMKQGRAVYSPIAHNHPIAVRHELPRSWDFWQLMDLPILARASRLWVLTIPGWKESQGVAAEMAFAKAALIPTQTIREEEYQCG